MRLPADYDADMADASLATKDAIVAAVRRLPPSEQVDVLMALHEVLPVSQESDESADDELSEAQYAELERRHAEYLANPDSAIELEQFEAELEDRFGDA
jgi:putative addiction module component (TIGR02574 family)